MYFLDLTPRPTVTLAKLWISEMHIVYMYVYMYVCMYVCMYVRMYVYIAQICVNKSLTPLLQALDIPQKPRDIWRPEPNFARHWDKEFSSP
jgi:hypothetical protein